MTNEQINIAIAEHCGWKVHPKDKWVMIPPNSPHSVQPLHTLPKYCNDLNAMHEATMSLEGPIRDHSFRRALAKSVGVIGVEDWEHSLVCLDKLTNATARQRAEAFLRTIGKWKEEVK